jgi:predicted Zn-ribbon and HTH transcriptional regulator
MKDRTQKQHNERRPAPPMERQETVRQEMISVLEVFGPLTARELSAEVRVREREVHEHLEHIRKSLEKTGKRLEVTPPECRKCGFVFADRNRLTKPGKCPSCRSTSIEAPAFKVSG